MDEQAACSVSCGAWVDDDGAYFGKMGSIDMERRTADKLLRFCFDDGEGSDVPADLRVRAAEKGAVVGEAIDELMYGSGVG